SRGAAISPIRLPLTQFGVRSLLRIKYPRRRCGPLKIKGGRRKVTSRGRSPSCPSRGAWYNPGRRRTALLARGGNVMSDLTRRGFLGHPAAAVGALAAGAALARAADAKPRPTSAASQVTLGRSGVKTSLLGMGTGSTGVKHSSNQVKLGEEKFKKL